MGDAGLGVTENSSVGWMWIEAGEPIGVIEVAMFSHAEIIPDSSKGENTKTSRTINKLKGREG
jgi:hypothetical protein